MVWGIGKDGWRGNESTSMSQMRQEQQLVDRRGEKLTLEFLRTIKHRYYDRIWNCRTLYD